MNPNKPSWPADKIERWPISKLTPYARNSRIHTPLQVAAIARSIQKFGWTTPVLVDETGRLIAGHARVMGAKKLGLKEIPVMVATNWSEADKKAYAIADNRLGESEFDNEMLIMELGELAELGFPLEFTGFDANSLSSLLSPPALDDEDEPTDDDEPKPGEPPAIKVIVGSVIDIPSVAAVLRKALKSAGYKAVKVQEPTA